MLRFDTGLNSHKYASDPAAVFVKKMLEDAKNFIVRIPNQYNRTITSDPAHEYAGWNCVHTPFPHLCVELEGGFNFKEYRYELFVFYCGKNLDHTRPEYPWMLLGAAIGSHLRDPSNL
nr:hypothetical protein [Synergistaceae bacterium]